MVAEITHLTTRRGGASLKQQTDVDLIQAVAARRDADAFGELFRRYKRQAFNLAYYVSRNKEIAEEAVQEGMLRVWSKANTFKVQDTDKVKSWIMCIVARSAQMSCRRRKREQEVIEQQAGDSASFALPQDVAGRNELLEAIRKELDNLPLDERTMMGLYFGAGMSQLQISKKLSMPQTTVSFRVKKIIEHLKGKLSAAGMGAVGTLTEVELITEAMCQQLPEPTGLEERIFAQLDKSAGKSSAGTSSLPFWITGCVFAASAIFYIAIFQIKGAGTEQVASEASTTIQLVSENSTPTESTEATFEGLHKIWNFEQEPMKGFGISQGKWEFWRPATKAGPEKPAGMVAGPKVVCRTLPISFPKRPVKVTLVTGINPRNNMKSAGAGLSFLANRGSPIDEEYWMNAKLRLKKTNHLNIEAYITEQYIVRLLNNQVLSIRKRKKSSSPIRIGVVARGVTISQIEVKECPFDAFPIQLRNLDRLFTESLQNPSWVQMRTSEYLFKTFSMSAAKRLDNVNPVREPQDHANNTKQSRLYKIWSVQNGPHPKLKMFKGYLSAWRPKDATGPIPDLTGKGEAAVLPVTLKRQPFRISVSINSISTRNQVTCLIYLKKDGTEASTYRVWHRTLRTKHRLGWGRYVLDAYFIGPYVIKCINGIPIAIRKFAKPFPSPYISILTRHAGVQQIELSEMPLDEMPKAFRTPDAFLAAVLKNPAWYE